MSIIKERGYGVYITCNGNCGKKEQWLGCYTKAHYLNKIKRNETGWGLRRRGYYHSGSPIQNREQTFCPACVIKYKEVVLKPSIFSSRKIRTEFDSVSWLAIQ